MTKRVFDLLMVLAGAVLWVPLAALVALFVRYKIGSPVLFVQQRPGLLGRPFLIYKFRTMTNAVNADDEPLPDAQRLTPFGRFLRSTSLDELPELLNILKGDMSLVGPRPLLMEYLPLYSPEQARRHEVRPGLTGWAQVNGRNAMTWAEKFRYDVWYVDNQSLGLDLRILLLTVRAVLWRQGITGEGEATVGRFTGNNGTSA